MKESLELNTKENLLNFVKENYKKMPILKSLTEDEIKKFVETGSVKPNKEDGLTTESLVIDTRGAEECSVISGYARGLDEYGEDDSFLTTQMSFKEDGNLTGTIYIGRDTIHFEIDKDGNIQMRFKDKMQEKIYNSIMANKTIVTHFGDDLDNKSSVYAIENWMKSNGLLANGEQITVQRVPAGQVKEGMLNVDTGGHKGNRIDDETIVIDGDPVNGVKSAAESLSKLGIYVPEQIVELADTKPNKVSALDSRSGIDLVRYLTGKQTFELAEDELLDKSLTDNQIEKYGLVEAHKKQQTIIDNAVKKIEQYTTELPNGEKVVLAPEQILGGSLIAYEMGVNYFASVSDHLDKDKNPDGVTFAITCKPGVKLPEEVIKYGQDLVEKYRIDEKSSGVFVNPNGQMIVAGGFKNPGFKIEGETKESMLNKVKDVFVGKEKEMERESR